MAELSVSATQDKEDPTIEPQMGKLGVYVYTDRNYTKAKQEIEDYFTIENNDIEELKISSSRKFLLKRTYKLMSFVNAQGTRGRGMDSPKFYRAMGAARNLLQRNIEDLMFCQAADDEVGLVCLDRLSCVEKLPMATYGKENTSILKAFTHIGTPQGQMGAPTMMPVQQLTQNSQKPSRSSGEYAGRAP